ncbi:hypothetical protein Tco_1134632 [Tanacetum coccineum]
MPLNYKASTNYSTARLNLVLADLTSTKEAQYEEVRKKSLRDFHKTYPSGFDDNNNEQDSRSEGSDQERDSGDDKAQFDSEKESNSEHETDENESGSESDQDENEGEDETGEEEKNEEFVRTPSNDTDDEDQTKIKDKAKGDEDEGIDYTTNQFDNDVNKTEVPITSSSHSYDLASKFLNFLDIPHTDAKIISLMDVHVHHEVPSNQTPTLLTLPVSVITESSPIFTTVISQSLPSFTPPPMVTKSLEHAVLAKESSQPKSTYEAAYLLTEFELKKILIDKMDESQSYLTAPEHKECYDGLIKSYDLDKSLFSTYDKDAEPTKGPKAKESQSGLSKGTKYPSKSSRKYVQSEELEFEVADFDMPQDQKKNLGNDDEEPKGKLMTLASSADKPSNTFDELMSTPIDFSAYIMNGLEISNLTQETLLWPSFKLLKGTRSNYAELEYDFEECYKALLEKLDWNNPTKLI